MTVVRLVSGLALAWIVGGSSLSQAQCAAGRVSTSAGYCCWPGQSWSDRLGRCDGPPQCPAPLVAAGPECVEPDPVLATPEVAPLPEPEPDDSPVPEEFRPEGTDGAVPVSPAPTHYLPPPSEVTSPEGSTTVSVNEPAVVVGAAWPSSESRPTGHAAPRRVAQLDHGLIAVGMTTLLAGYGTTITRAVLMFDRYDSSSSRWRPGAHLCHEQAGALGLIPLVGSVVSTVHYYECRGITYQEYGGLSYTTRDSRVNVQAGFVLMGILGGAAQLAGAVMLITGYLSPISPVLWEEDSEDAEASTVRLQPTASGLALSGTFR